MFSTPLDCDDKVLVMKISLIPRPGSAHAETVMDIIVHSTEEEGHS